MQWVVKDMAVDPPVWGAAGLSDWLLRGTHHKGLTTADYCVVAAYVIVVVFVGSRCVADPERTIFVVTFLFAFYCFM